MIACWVTWQTVLRVSKMRVLQFSYISWGLTQNTNAEKSALLSTARIVYCTAEYISSDDETRVASRMKRQSFWAAEKWQWQQWQRAPVRPVHLELQCAMSTVNGSLSYSATCPNRIALYTQTWASWCSVQVAARWARGRATSSGLRIRSKATGSKEPCYRFSTAQYSSVE